MMLNGAEKMENIKEKQENGKERSRGMQGAAKEKAHGKQEDMQRKYTINA
jgi:hypothetical protein